MKLTYSFPRWEGGFLFRNNLCVSRCICARYKSLVYKFSHFLILDIQSRVFLRGRRSSIILTCTFLFSSAYLVTALPNGDSRHPSDRRAKPSPKKASSDDCPQERTVIPVETPMVFFHLSPDLHNCRSLTSLSQSLASGDVRASSIAEYPVSQRFEEWLNSFLMSALSGPLLTRWHQHHSRSGELDDKI